MIIHGWEKFNPRKDYKKPWWFALSNRLLEDPDFFDFTAEELKAWLYILSRASQENSSEIIIRTSHADRVCKIKPKAMSRSIDKLVRLGVISTSVQIRSDSVRDLYSTEQNNTEQNKTNNIAHFDFESLYQKYPKKIGKAKGVAKCRAEITTQEDFDLLATAIERYRSHCKAKGIEEQFIKHFSTFMGSWREWLDPVTGTSESFEKKAGPNWDKIRSEVGA